MLGYFILGIALLLGLAIGGNALANAKPEKIARAFRITALLILVAVTVFFALTGRMQVASALAFMAIFLLKNKPFFGRKNPSSGQSSDVKTSWLHATLDHDSGEMNAVVLKGTFEGKRLSELSLEELHQLHGDLSRDAQSASILETYIARCFPDEEMNDAHEQQTSGKHPTGMSMAEAYEILELNPGATVSEIKSAHRRLIKKFHPDHDGSAYMAAKINLAKDILTKS